MTRALTEQDVLHDLRTVGFYNDSATTGTIAGATVRGATTFDVQAGEGTALNPGDVIRLDVQGSGAEIIVVDSVATDTVTPLLPLAKPHVDTAPYAVLTLVDMGALSDTGLTLAVAQDITPLNAGTQKSVYLELAGAVTQNASWELLDFNAENVAQSLGMDEADVVIVSANGVQVDPEFFVTLSTKPWLFEGPREDGLIVSEYVANAKVAAAAQEQQWTTGQARILPMNISITGVRSIVIQ